MSCSCGALGVFVEYREGIGSYDVSSCVEELRLFCGFCGSAIPSYLSRAKFHIFGQLERKYSIGLRIFSKVWSNIHSSMFGVVGFLNFKLRQLCEACIFNSVSEVRFFG